MPLEVIAAFFIGHFLLLEPAIVEAGDRQFGLPAGPFSHQQIPVTRLGTHRGAGADEHVTLWITKGHVKDLAIAKLSAGDVRLPGRTRDENEIAVACIAPGSVALVSYLDLVGCP